MQEENKVYIIRRIKKVKKAGHHGGSWKIAYADFVTAMMAFFLLMWLLTLMNKYQLDGIAEYFRKPLKEAFTHQSDKQNKDKDKEKFKEKEKEREKEKEKEKPNKIDQIQHTLNQTEKNIAQAVQQMNPNQAANPLGLDVTGINVTGQKVFSDKTASEMDLVQVLSGQQATDPFWLKNNEIKALLNQQAQDVSAANSPEEKQIKEIQAHLQKELENNPMMQQYKNQLNFIVTADGLRIELRDLQNKPMFSLGKTDFQTYAKPIISWLTAQLNAYPDRRLVIIGHTDTLQYQDNDYSNWELSADRANATRRELVHNGMSKERILRIVGVGDTNLFDSTNGKDPSNRRIEIIVLTNEAMQKLLNDNK